MIVCFSGTGNTRHVANLLHEALGDEVVRFAPGQMRDPDRIHLQVPDGRLVWAFPVYGWGIPVKAENIMRRMTIISAGPLTHHMVCTCGDDIGNTERQWRALAADRGWNAVSAYSVQMPNTFTFMKGFDVDAPEVVAAKMAAAPARVAHIADRIAAGVAESDVVRGSWPWVKSSVIRPWFNRVKVGCRNFSYTADCRGCGRCARNCPFGAISMVNGHPRWQGECTLCGRCYHLCPHHAVAYGKATRGKGQYLCEGYTLQP